MTFIFHKSITMIEINTEAFGESFEYKSIEITSV